MLTLPNYHIHTQIYESVHSLVYRGTQLADQRPVILKFLKADYPTPEDLARYRHEYEMLRYLDPVSGVISVYGLELWQQTLILVLEDFGGESLKSWIPQDHLTISECLTLAIQIADYLGQIHANQVIHKDLNPANLVWNPQTNQLKLIDFGIASRLPREMPSLKSPEQLEGTLAYLSPEQTGRMNRSLDYRSDLYSLGVTLYELFTGRLPFATNDPMELVHCHLAKLPLPPQQIYSEIPPVISNLILRLMAKNAEERYQSAWGVKYDLAQILANLTSLADLSDLKLAQQDISGHFHLPQKLYGREAEIETLWQAFERVSQGPSELLLIAGYSGIGKTSLVQELYKPITAKRGYFLAGKFDQLQRNVPYSALLQAFRQLTQQLLTESTATLQRWQQRLLSAVGNNGQVIIDVLPEVELLLGKQLAVPDLPPTESQNRFNLVFQNFIRACCQPEHPLVIFLDDLQWVDSASLKLMSLMMNDIPYLLLIGAYRDNEVNATHPLVATVTEMHQTGVTVQTLTLTPLRLPHIMQLLAEALSVTISPPLGKEEKQPPLNSLLNKKEGLPEISPLLTKEGLGVVTLAQLLLEKTGGNPFFLAEFLKTLYTEQLLQFNYQQRHWQWDLAQIQARNITDNVVELMVNKIQQLPTATQTQLQWAAALGNQFDLTTLATVTQQTPEVVTQELWEALVAGLIVKVDDAYRFVHDRVQQAAYSLIPEAERAAWHWQIGQLWLSDSTRVAEKLFEVVDHLNLGVTLADTQTAKTQIARLNLQAGQKAKSATAYQSAAQYLQMALSLLPENSWDTDYEFILILHNELTEVAYLNGDYAQVEYWAEVVLQKAKTVLHRVKVYEIRILAKTAEKKPLESIAIGLEAVAQLGVTLPLSPTPQDIQEALKSTTAAIPNQDILALIDLPEMTDARALAILRLLLSLFLSTFSANPSLLMLNVSSQIKLSLQYGNTAISAYSYVIYGLVLSGIGEEIDSVYQCGQLALKLVDKFQAIHLKCKIFHLIGTFIAPVRQHLKEVNTILLEGYQNALETGDLEYMGYTLMGRYRCAYLLGQELTLLEREVKSGIEVIYRSKQGTAWNWLQALYLALPRLLHSGTGTGEMVPSEANFLASLKQSGDKHGFYQFHLYQLTVFYVLEDYSTASMHANQAKQYLVATTSLVIKPAFYFYHSLSLLAICNTEPNETILAEVTANQEKLKRLSVHAPMNYQHKYDLVAAETARVIGHFEAAVNYYEKAIVGARKNEYLQEEALAYELTAKFYLAHGLEDFAQTYLTKAYHGYQRWGAIAKLKQLEEKYPQWLATIRTPLATSTMTTKTTHIETILATATRTRASTSANWLDLESVMKAAQTLSGEIVWSRLLDKMMHILIENAGAQRGVLLLPQDGQWQPAAEGYLDTDMVTISPSQILNTPLPEMIISYVARTQEPLVLTEARQDGRYATHPYVQAHQLLSVLCFPIVYQQQLRAILYLENNLTPGVFTPARLDILQMLSGQIAISLENAQLMAHLDAKVQERTAELNAKVEELTQTRQELVQSEKMASLGRLVAGFAHELNTPLGVALGSASALLREAQKIQQWMSQDEVDADELLAAMADIEQGANLTLSNLDRAANLVTSFKRTAVNQTSGDIRTFRVLEVIEDTVNTLHNHFKATQVQIHVECPADLKIKSQPGALEQILTNLLMNSLIHGFEEGQRAGQISVTVECQSNLLQLIYTDNGKGIAPEHLAKIFEPFFTTHRAHGGSGLGMYICYNLVTTQLQGTIACESELGKGTIFKIRYPI